jgi:hypothetical protein
MRQRLPLVLSVTALAVALLGSTPVGQASTELIQTIPPFAKQAGFARLAGTADNAKRLGGHRPSEFARLDASGKLPASLGAVGPKGDPGPKGAPGSTGERGPAGPNGVVNAFAKDTGTGPVQVTPTSNYTTVLSLPLAAGKYVLLGRAHLGQGGAAQYSGFCQIVAGTDIDTTGVQGAKNSITGGVGSGSNVFVSVIHQFTAAGTAELKCWSPPAAPTTWSGAKITAIQIASTGVKSLQP